MLCIKFICIVLIIRNMYFVLCLIKKVKGVVFNNKVFMNFKFCYFGINKMEIICRFFKI